MLKFVFSLSLLCCLRAATAQTCRWGLVPNNDCTNLERDAAERMDLAKTVCMSADSGVSWPKTLHNPNTAATFRAMHRAYFYARTGYSSLADCGDADLVFKFEVEMDDHADLTVYDSESGETVFHERRNLTDQTADLHRLALHFVKAHQEAKEMRSFH